MTAPALAESTTMGRLYRRPGSAVTGAAAVRAAVGDGRLVPSVTNVIEVLNKPYLTRWYAKRAAEDAVEVARKHAGLIQSKPDEALRWIAAAATRTSDAAAALGDEVHQAAELLALGREVPDLGDRAKPYVESWHAFVRDHNPTFVRTEATCYGLTPDGLGYAGTADFIATIDGRLLVGDYKTGSAIHTEASLQLASLAHCTEIVLEDMETMAAMPPIDGGLVVHLTPKGYTLYDADVFGAPWDLFCQLRRLWDFHHQNLGSRAPLFLTKRA